MSGAFWERKGQNSNSSLAVLCKQVKILVTRSWDTGRASQRKSLPVDTDHSGLLPEVLPPGLSLSGAHGSRVSTCVLTYSTFVHFLLLFSFFTPLPVFFFFLPSFSVCKVLKTPNNREGMGWEKERKKRKCFLIYCSKCSQCVPVGVWEG